MPSLRLPPDVEAVLRQTYTCEFTTVNRRGQPVTWPILPYYHEPDGVIVITSSIAFPAKTANARRHPQVALLYSDPTGSHLADPPAVLVQGDAEVSEVLDQPPWAVPLFKTSLRRQPESRAFVGNPIARRLFAFYFQRIAVVVHPRRILVWPRRDFRAAAEEIGVE